MSYFLLYSYSKNKIEIELDLPNYETKSDLKNATGVYTLQFAKKDDLANLKSEVDKLDIDKLSELDGDKLKLFPVDLSKLSDVIKNDLKKIYIMPRSKSYISNLATNNTLNAKIN